MKKYILLAAAALTLAACNNDEVTTVPTGDVALQVNASISKTATRAAGTAWAENDVIGISTTSTGATHYTNVCYQYAGGTFTAQPADDAIYFQDLDEVTFSAYYPYAGAQGASAGTVTKTITAADQTADAQPQIDYLFASGATASKNSPTVNFTGDNAFSHCMTQISVRFTEGDDVDFTGLMTGYTLAGLYMTGTFNTETGEATGNADEEDLTITLDNVTATGGVYTTNPVIVFPQSATSIDMTVDIKNTAGDMQAQTYRATLTVPAAGNGTGLQPGYHYVFPVTVSKTGLIVGTAKIKDWVEVAAGGATAQM